MSVSIQIIDNVYGSPAVGVPIRIARVTPGGWAEQGHEQTDERGLVRRLSETMIEGGSYTLECDLGKYFSSFGIDPFFSAVSIRIRMADVYQPHHISLFITPYSYATYHVNRSVEVQ